MRTLFLLLLLTGQMIAQDLSSRVRREILDQLMPVTVHVSMRGITTLQFPDTIQALESDGFTQKPNEEVAAFSISPGLNWVSIRSLQEGAVQNLGVVIKGKVYEILIRTVTENDFSVLFYYATAKPARAQRVWSPLTEKMP
jgi:hypothetical protein